MMRNNMRASEEIKEQLMELLALKRGSESNTEDLLKSKNEIGADCVTFDCLEGYIYHHDHEIKLNTLALVVESKKSTLKFTAKELEMVLLFLRVNFKEKIEYVPYIKKALRRMRDSLAAMRRQCKQEQKMRDHYRRNCTPSEIKQEILDESYRISASLEKDIDVYRKVLQTLRDMCVCKADATYYRRKCSLEILALMKDLLNDELKNIPWKPEQMENIFQLMLLDTYEANKNMAFNLIQSEDPNLLQLGNKGVVHDIIMVAIELGNSVRPIDTITAAYMLKISMLSPVVQTVLETHLDSMKMDENITEGPVLQLILILLNRLKESLILAKRNIVKTVFKHSLYGYLFCIRSLLQDCNLKNAGEGQLWQTTIAELVAICFQFTHAVAVIVNNSSPEGHLPMDLNLQTISDVCGSESEKQIVTPQMVLLCSWRTIKEVSLLFGLLATRAPIGEEDAAIGLLKEEQIIRIGEHLVSLLTETKHRGAFEQAHVGFSQLCSRLWRMNKSSLNRLPKLWLHQILITITGIQENSKLCATRRSAGVPFMIQALLSTEPRQHKDTTTATFDTVMKILLGFTQLESKDLREKAKQLLYSNPLFAQFESSFASLKEDNTLSAAESVAQLTEIKTHALNILRAIFRHSQLGEIVNNYIQDGIIAAFKSYDASTWGERNAATLLFSALIIRIFGVQRTKDHINLTAENKMHYGLFFKKYPDLLPFILNELSTHVATDDTLIKSNVQSILLLLSRLYHSRLVDTGTVPQSLMINDLIDLIVRCATSAVYETRKLAARALVPFLSEESVGSVLIQLTKNIVSTGESYSSLNVIHGYMLQMYEILKHFGSKLTKLSAIEWNTFLRKSTWILENLERNNSKPPCFLLAAVFVNIFNEICKTDKGYLTENLSIIHLLVSHLLCQKLKQGAARELYKTTAIRLVRSIWKETGLIESRLPIKIYLYNLRIPETQVSLWSIVAEVINELECSETSAMLLNYAVEEIRSSMQRIHRHSPEIQDGMFHFLYSGLMYLKQCKVQDCVMMMDICKFVLSEIRLNKHKGCYDERDSYLRLLGGTYVILASLTKNKDTIDMECTDDVYSSFCDDLWITSLSKKFRSSVFDIMQDLFLACYQREECRFVQVQWWTTVLKLLMDNNPEVRHQAFLLLDNVPVYGTTGNKWPHVNLLLCKFYECNVHDRNPEFICAVLFYWSMALFDDIDYEMDETDVFNKCTNYDFFESVEVSRMCGEFLIRNMERYMDNVLPEDVINWLNTMLNINFQKSISFRTLAKDYGRHVPALENKLYDILNPTYKNKLLQVLAYRQYKSIF